MIFLVILVAYTAFYLQRFYNEVETSSIIIAKLGHLVRPLSIDDFFNKDKMQRKRQDMEKMMGYFRNRTVSVEPDLFNETVTDYWIPIQNNKNILARRYFYNDMKDVVYHQHQLLLWFHGGGWTRGSVETDDLLCRRIARESKAVVLSIDYGLAPENPFPGPFFDAYFSFLWARENAALLGIDPNRIVVGGESSGGNLAAAIVSYHLSLESTNPFNGVLLIYPPLAPVSMDVNFTFNGWLTYEIMEVLREVYSNKNPKVRYTYTFSPLLTPVDVLSKYPAKTIVVVAGQDVLATENRLFVEKLRKTGVPVQLHEYNSTIHGFFGRNAFSKYGEDALKKAIMEIFDK